MCKGHKEDIVSPACITYLLRHKESLGENKNATMLISISKTTVFPSSYLSVKQQKAEL